MWARFNLPLAAKALAHGELFLRDITGRALTVGHGFGKRRGGLGLERKKLHSGKDKGKVQMWLLGFPLREVFITKSGMPIDFLKQHRFKNQ